VHKINIFKFNLNRGKNINKKNIWNGKNTINSCKVQINMFPFIINFSLIQKNKITVCFQIRSIATYSNLLRFFISKVWLINLKVENNDSK